MAISIASSILSMCLTYGHSIGIVTTIFVASKLPTLPRLMAVISLAFIGNRRVTMNTVCVSFALMVQNVRVAKSFFANI